MSFGATFVDPDAMSGPIPSPQPALDFPEPPPASMKCTPAPCALPNADVSAGTTMPANETPIAVNPLNAKLMIAGANSYNCDTRYLSFWTSGDGGKTWSGGCVQSLPGATRAGDPILGYDLNGTVYQGGVNVFEAGAAISVASSSDNGKTWSTPIAAVNISNDFADKPWLAIDTNARSLNRNNLYISNTMYDDQSGNATIYVTTSKDGGQTWNSAPVSGTALQPNLYQGSDLAIGSDGTVYVTYVACTTPEGRRGDDCGDTVATVYLQKSTDAGSTWSAPVVIDTPTLAPSCSNGLCIFGCLPNTLEPVTEIPVIGIDNSGGAHDGNLYVADWSWTGSYMQVQVKTSNDGGNTWSAPVLVAPNTDTHDQFAPWLSVAADGKVGVTWMDRRNDPKNLKYEEFGTWSSDGGTTFNAPDIQLAKKASNPDNDGLKDSSWATTAAMPGPAARS